MIKNGVLLLLLVVSAGCSAADRRKVDSFAVELRESMVEGDRNKLSSMRSFPGVPLSEDEMDYILGEERGGGIAGFALARSLEIKVFGPYSLPDQDSLKGYTIVYYQPSVLKPEDTGLFDLEKIAGAWGQGYLETNVTVSDGEVLFYRSPFYYAAGLPWEGDY